MLHLALLTLTFVLDAAAAPATAAPATSYPAGYQLPEALYVAHKVQAYYDKTLDFKAKFQQIYKKAFHGIQAPRYGYLWVKKPGLMRWDYVSPRKKQLISDGKKLWIYVPGDKQVFWRDLRNTALPTAVTFLWGRGKLLTDFWVKLVGGSKYTRPGTLVLKLLPKQTNANFKHLLFVVDLQTGMVRESLLFDHLGNRNHYIFSQTRSNTRVPTSTFHFTPPRGVRVIRATKDVHP